MTERIAAGNDHRNYLIFGLLAVVLVTIECLLIQETWFPLTGVVPLAVLLDFALILPLLYYFLVLRPKRQGIFWALPVAMSGMVCATALLPTLPHALTAVIEIALVAFELGILVMLARSIRGVWKAIRETGRGDFLDSIRAATANTHPALRLAAEEIATFYYSLVGWRKATPAGPDCFSYHRETSLGLMLGVLVFLSLPEMGIVHYLVGLWNHTAAWIVTGLSVYSLFWLAALYQAARLRPMRLTEERALLRVSLLWSAAVPYEQIARAERITGTNEDPAALQLGLLGEPAIRLTLHTPATVHGIFGRRREAAVLDLVVDEPARFLSEIQTRRDLQEQGTSTVS